MKTREGWTPQVTAAVPPALLAAARERLGIPEGAPESDIVRAALARSAGVDLADFPLRPSGRAAWRPRTAATA